MRRRLTVGVLGLTAVVGVGGLLARRSARHAEVPMLSLPALNAAIDYVGIALARDPDNPMLAGQLVNRLILRFGRTADLADIERAETLASHAVMLASNRSSALGRLSGVQLMQHKFATALATARSAVVADSGSREAHGVLLEAALAAGDYQTADWAAQHLDAGSVSGRVQRALWLDTRGDTPAARKELGKACRELERSAASPEGRAWCLVQLANMAHSVVGPEEARAILEYVRRFDPVNRGATEGLANLAMGREDWAEARRLLSGILSRAHPDLFLRMAEVEGALGNQARATEMTTRFLGSATAPGSEALFGNVLALHYAERGDQTALDSALAIGLREVGRRPTTESYDLLGWIHYRRGEYQPALEASDAALRIGLSPTAGYHRARILEAVGRAAESAILDREASSRPTLLAPHARRDLRIRTAGRVRPSA